MKKRHAQDMVHSIVRTHVDALREGGEVNADTAVQALLNAESDLILLVADIVDQCVNGVDVEGAIDEAEEITRGARN